MTLSVIVVSYNVKGYLSLCLDSAIAAMDRLGDGQSELVVFDNASSDGSADWVSENYPSVQVIRSEENLGFSAGNNAAIRQSSGRWVLLLNPDTVVPEDTFERVLAHAEAHPDVGAIGVPMFDGAGQWLPESKRGLPTPWASFCRLSGLWRLAPRSRSLNRYYCGHIAQDETAEVEVLSGAFMWLRREALDQAGLLDEDFFMYGEDIDLSVRIQRAGWVNHYCSEAPIVHFKGESTKKGSLAYVRVFHDAMRIFSGKHFAGGQAFAMRSMIELGIRARSVSAFLQGRVRRHALPLMEVGLSFAVAFVLVRLHEWSSGIGHPWWPTLVLMAIAGVSAGLGGVWFGAMDRPFVRVRTLLAGLASGLAALALYAAMPEGLRVSRAAVGMLVLSLLLLPLLLRMVLVALLPRRFRWRPARAAVALMASESRLDSVRKWVESSYGSSLNVNILNFPIGSDGLVLSGRHELVLCDASLGGSAVLAAIRAGRRGGVDVRVIPGSFWLALGGARRDSGPGELLPWGADGLGRVQRGRAKRRVDVLWSLWILLVGGGRGRHRNSLSRPNALAVLSGKKTWLGFHGGWSGEERLPALQPGVFKVGSGDAVDSVGEAKRLDLRYAFDFGWVRDLELLMTLRMD